MRLFRSWFRRPTEAQAMEAALRAQKAEYRAAVERITAEVRRERLDAGEDPEVSGGYWMSGPC